MQIMPNKHLLNFAYNVVLTSALEIFKHTFVFKKLYKNIKTISKKITIFMLK